MFMRTTRHRDSSSSSHHSSRASVLDTSGSTASTTLSVEQVPKSSSLNIFFRWKNLIISFPPNYCAVGISFLCYWSTISTRHILWALSLLLFFSIWSIFTQEPDLTEKEVLGFAWQVNKMSIVRLIGWHKTDKKCKNCVQWSDENLPCIGTKEDDFLTFAFFWLVWQPLLYLFDWD